MKTKLNDIKVKFLNRRGYMLVEIILASVIAFGIAYFIINLTIKLKNKNDDLLVETQVVTDQTIITNKLMNYAKSEEKDFTCDIKKDGKKIYYTTKDGNKELVDIVNDYATIGNIDCENASGVVSVTIPLDVKQMSERNFDVQIDYKYRIGDMIDPECSITISSNKLIATYSDNDGGSGIDYYGWNSSYSGSKSSEQSISTGNKIFYVSDKAGNRNTCTLSVVDATPSTTYTCTKNYDACPEGWMWQTNGCFYYSSCTTPNYHWSCPRFSATGDVEIDTTTPANPHPEHCGLTSSYCKVCPSGYRDYGSPQYCYKSQGYSECSSGWTKKDGACYKDDENSCGSFTMTDTNTTYSCPDEYTKASDDKYCFK